MTNDLLTLIPAGVILWMAGAGVTLALANPNTKHFGPILGVCVFAWPFLLGAVLMKAFLNRSKKND